MVLLLMKTKKILLILEGDQNILREELHNLGEEPHILVEGQNILGEELHNLEEEQNSQGERNSQGEDKGIEEGHHSRRRTGRSIGRMRWAGRIRMGTGILLVAEQLLVVVPDPVEVVGPLEVGLVSVPLLPSLPSFFFFFLLFFSVFGFV